MTTSGHIPGTTTIKCFRCGNFSTPDQSRFNPNIKHFVCIECNEQLAKENMMTQAIEKPDFAGILERVLIVGDLAKLTPEERVNYYNRTCESLELNPLTRPFEYITLDGRMVLYARKDCADQLRMKRKVSIKITAREQQGDCWVVTALATMPDGRTDESVGAVSIKDLKGSFLANAIMKAETKAKRRVTLSICGLGMLDETEVEAIPGAAHAVAATHQDLHHIDSKTGYAGEPAARVDPNAPQLPAGSIEVTAMPTNVAEQLENLAKLKTIIAERKVAPDVQAKWCEMFGGVASIDQLSDENILKIIKKYESLSKSKAAA